MNSLHHVEAHLAAGPEIDQAERSDQDRTGAASVGTSAHVNGRIAVPHPRYGGQP